MNITGLPNSSKYKLLFFLGGLLLCVLPLSFPNTPWLQFLSVGFGGAFLSQSVNSFMKKILIQRQPEYEVRELDTFEGVMGYGVRIVFHNPNDSLMYVSEIGRIRNDSGLFERISSVGYNVVDGKYSGLIFLKDLGEGFTIPPNEYHMVSLCFRSQHYDSMSGEFMQAWEGDVLAIRLSSGKLVKLLHPKLTELIDRSYAWYKHWYSQRHPDTVYIVGTVHDSENNENGNEMVNPS